ADTPCCDTPAPNPAWRPAPARGAPNALSAANETEGTGVDRTRARDWPHPPAPDRASSLLWATPLLRAPCSAAPENAVARPPSGPFQSTWICAKIRPENQSAPTRPPRPPPPTGSAPGGEQAYERR